VKANGFKIKELSAFKPKVNPFLQDEFHMGTALGSNLMVFHSKHSSEIQPYIILININNGKRIRIDIEEVEEVKDDTADK
jgi:hypothetical protein